MGPVWIIHQTGPRAKVGGARGGQRGCDGGVEEEVTTMGREQGLADAPCWVPVFPAEPAGHIHFVTNMGWDAGGRQKLVQPAMVQTHSYVNCQY